MSVRQSDNGDGHKVRQTARHVEHYQSALSDELLIGRNSNIQIFIPERFILLDRSTKRTGNKYKENSLCLILVTKLLKAIAPRVPSTIYRL
jgi:hypothetical protein